MAGKTVSFPTQISLGETCAEHAARWLSCNGEMWGVGPTLVFASAAVLFLYHELEATVLVPGDRVQIAVLEKSLIVTMVLGMLALMTHVWVCSMRFFQYYLDTLIKDSPNMLLEITTAGLLGNKADMMPLGPLTRFLRQQQPQIHITVCWFLALCYADYVRKHYCRSFNLPYLEQWQTELQSRAVRGVNSTVARVSSFVGAVHRRLRGYRSQEGDGSRAAGLPTARAQAVSGRWSTRPWAPTAPRLPAAAACSPRARPRNRSCASGSWASLVRPLPMLSRSSELLSRNRDARLRRKTSAVLAAIRRRSRSEQPAQTQTPSWPCGVPRLEELVRLVSRSKLLRCV